MVSIEQSKQGAAMRHKLYIVGTLQLYLILKLTLNNAAELKFTNAVCTSYNQSWITVQTCNLKAISRNKTVFNFNGTVLHPAYVIDLEAEFFLKANGYKPWLYKPQIDICRFVAKPYNPVAVLVYKALRKFSNFNHSCPFVGVQTVSGFYMRYEEMRAPVPSGEYLLKVNWLFDKRIQISTNVYFRVQE